MNRSTITIIIFFAIVFSAFLLSGCGGDGDVVLAKVDGDKIMAKDLDDIFAQSRRTFNSFEDEFENRRTILDSLVIQQLLIQEAYEKNIDESEEVNRIVLGNKDQFLLDVLYLRKVVDEIKVTEDEIKDFYDKLEYKLKASHIVVASEDTANMIVDSLGKGGVFENLAVSHSVDPTATRNQGDLGYFVWGQMDPVFLENVFKMNPGEISQPFQTKYGWHIVKLVDRTPNELRGSFEKMSDQIKGSLESIRRNERLNSYREELHDKYSIRIDTVTCEYLMRKRASLYPPTLLETLPKNDFDLEQLDRDEMDLIIASWDGGQMTVGDYLRKVKQARTAGRPNLDDYDKMAEFVFNLNLMSILSFEARQLGLEDDAEFKRKLRRFKELTMADVMENDSLPIADEVDEGEMRQYYEDNQREFTVPEKIHVYEILFNDYSTAKTYALKIRSLQRFKSIASEYTERPGKRASGGDLGWIEQRIYPKLFPVAKEADIGDVTAPVQQGKKYSIMYVAEKKPEEIKDFLMVKQNIKEKIERERRKQAFVDWVEKRKTEADIEIFEDNLRASINEAKYEMPDTTSS
ncbi:MAG: peptidylprolyl isomerase [Candidatus Zixiibacteriota bacterium]|nr:MAG: peptidylprolyl isomerase [candidate division Zixibacteria bacterium]